MQRGRLVTGDKVGELVRHPLDAEWVALQDDDELEQHLPLLLLLQPRRRDLGGDAARPGGVAMPEPAAGLNFLRGHMTCFDWLSRVAVRIDAWLAGLMIRLKLEVVAQPEIVNVAGALEVVAQPEIVDVMSAVEIVTPPEVVDVVVRRLAGVADEERAPECDECAMVGAADRA
ncbi:hypothetical protein QYE76_013863 [Lolium multiflorum]|uniref:Alfin N-terminal domain-containing protein n=1 Tax=Lolium multiflorum TaxID=4521 RepID=A0AAD8U1I3_LOLMU|nr:hypothetical protein QYE76_013863 [Lolium multiflorum]